MLARTARGIARDKFHVKLCGVTFIDAAGKALLKAIYSDGAQLIADGCLNQAIVQEITTEAKSAVGEKRSKGPSFFFYALFFSLLWSAKPGFAQAPTQSFVTESSFFGTFEADP